MPQAPYHAAVADMQARGYTMVQSGRNGETRFGYFDTDGRSVR